MIDAPKRVPKVEGVKVRMLYVFLNGERRVFGAGDSSLTGYMLCAVEPWARSPHQTPCGMIQSHKFTIHTQTHTCLSKLLI